jgi:hypothetical protein
VEPAHENDAPVDALCQNGGKLAHGPIHDGDQRGSTHFRFAARTLSGRKLAIFWALLARGDRPVEDARFLGNVNCAENLLRGQPQYNIAGSN